MPCRTGIQNKEGKLHASLGEEHRRAESRCIEGAGVARLACQSQGGRMIRPRQSCYCSVRQFLPVPRANITGSRQRGLCQPHARLTRAAQERIFQPGLLLAWPLLDPRKAVACAVATMSRGATEKQSHFHTCLRKAGHGNNHRT